jgi:hypothetical protein
VVWTLLSSTAIAVNRFQSTSTTPVDEEFNVNKLMTIFGLLCLALPAFSADKFACVSIDDNQPYEMERFEMSIESDSQVSVTMDLLKLVTETYQADEDYQPRAAGMRNFSRFDVVKPDYDAYGEGPLTPLYIENPLFKGGRPLQGGGRGGMVKVAGWGYSWARYLCKLQ